MELLFIFEQICVNRIKSHEIQLNIKLIKHRLLFIGNIKRGFKDSYTKRGC